MHLLNLAQRFWGSFPRTRRHFWKLGAAEVLKVAMGNRVISSSSLWCVTYSSTRPHCDSASSKLAGFSFSFTHRLSRPPFNIVHREAVHCCLQLTSEIGVSNQKENFRLTWVSQTVYARPVSLKLSNLLLFSTAEQFFCLQIWLLDYCVVCFALVECCH